MSDKIEHNADPPYSNENDSQMQRAPMPAHLPKDHFIQPLLKPLVFPLIRRASVAQQIWSMLLYSALIILTIVSSMFILGNFLLNDPTSSNLYGIFLFLFAILVLSPASSLLCAVLFGSWRGALVSLIGITGGIQITHLLNHSLWGDMSFLGRLLFVTPVFIVVLLVGLAYDVRKYASVGNSIVTIALGTPIPALFLSILFSYVVPSSNLDNAAMGFCCLAIFLIPVWVLVIVGLEYIIQKFLVSRHKRG